MITTISRQRTKCIRKFLHYFPGGFRGRKYQDWERDYKWLAHIAWKENLYKKEYELLLRNKDYVEIARRAVWLESRTNLLFSFEKMALRDAVKSEAGARLFSEGLFDWIYGKANLQHRFESFTEMLGALPRKQTRVLTWPLQTVFGFIADPEQHIFLKPRVTQVAAVKYDFTFDYRSGPNWDTYKSLLDFTEQLRADTASLGPRDMIDLQSFIWVMGSDEYPD
jgi:hypothetical protein